MTEWVIRAVVLALHEEQLAEHGGSPGIRDEALLESALARSQNLQAYGDPTPTLCQMAATLAYGLAKDHPFPDGNKRVSAVTTETFLILNGLDLTCTDAEIVTTWVALANGDMTEAEMAAWLAAHTTRAAV